MDSHDLERRIMSIWVQLKGFADRSEMDSEKVAESISALVRDAIAACEAQLTKEQNSHRGTTKQLSQARRELREAKRAEAARESTAIGRALIELGGCYLAWRASEDYFVKTS